MTRFQNMTNVNDTTKVILLPNDVKSLEIIRIKLEDTYKSLAVSKENLYELREIGPSSDYDLRGEPHLPSGEPVKSLVLEFTNEGPVGAVLANPNFICCTRFDLVFPFLRWMAIRWDVYVARFHSIDDISEAFSDWVGASPSFHKLEQMIKHCIERTCDSVQENGEFFFRFSLPKVHNVLSTKIDRFKNLILENPEYVLAKKIKETLSDSQNEIPASVLEQQVTRYCTDFVFSSFLGDSSKKKFSQGLNKEHSELDVFLKGQESKRKNADIAEQNLASIATSSKSGPEIGKGKNIKATKSIKKQSNKVAVGKGALDVFFKKK